MRILHNARIHTMNVRQTHASALVVHEGRILAVGEDNLLHEYPDAERQDLAGRYILPGLVDGHLHLQLLTLNPQKLNCEVTEKETILNRVAEKVKVTPAGEWILGHGWNQNTWGGEWPSASDLDAVAPHHPVYLTAKSLHAGWTNSLALLQAGIGEATPDPRGGVILRAESGKPLGILLEKAMDLVENAITKPNPDKLAVLFEQVIPRLWQVGLTGIHNFDRESSYRALQVLNDRGDLRLRVLQFFPREDMEKAIALGLRTGMGDDMLRIGSVKLFSDGALGPHTAAMLDPYVDEPENRGILLLTAEDVFEYGRTAAAAGLSLAVHAIGDRANREVLDGFSRLRAFEIEQGMPALRHRIEHVQVIHPQDAGRLADLDILASMQPFHATSDFEMAERSWGERSALAYAWRTIVQQGTKLVFGSDAPVENPNPFLGLHAAVTRLPENRSPALGGWYPEQCLTIREALEAYTLGPAFSAGMEEKLGMLASGYYADLIVMDIDPMTCDPAALRSAQPCATMVAGEWVWQA